MKKHLNPKQMLYVKNLTKGHTKKDAAKLAGYADSTVAMVNSKLMKNEAIKAELARLGLDDRGLSRVLKQHIQDGIGIKSTADTSLRATELVLRLRGNLDKEESTATTNNTLIYNDYTDSQLQERLKELQGQVESMGTVPSSN